MSSSQSWRNHFSTVVYYCLKKYQQKKYIGGASARDVPPAAGRAPFSVQDSQTARDTGLVPGTTGADGVQRRRRVTRTGPHGRDSTEAPRPGEPLFRSLLLGRIIDQLVLSQDELFRVLVITIDSA